MMMPQCFQLVVESSVVLLDHSNNVL